MYEKADWISTASGSERGRSLKPARSTDPFCHLSMPYIDLQSALALAAWTWLKIEIEMGYTLCAALGGWRAA
jgi:hypothetical protein